MSINIGVTFTVFEVTVFLILKVVHKDTVGDPILHINNSREACSYNISEMV